MADYTDIALANAEIDRLRALLPKPWYDTPEYWASVRDTNDRIAGHNHVIAAYRDAPDGVVKLPPAANAMFRRGAEAQARLRDVVIV